MKFVKPFIFNVIFRALFSLLLGFKNYMSYKRIIISISIGMFYFITSAIYLNRAVVEYEVVLKTHQLSIYDSGFKKHTEQMIKKSLNNIKTASLYRSIVYINATPVTEDRKGQYIYVNVKSIFSPHYYSSSIDVGVLQISIEKELRKLFSNSSFSNLYSISKLNMVANSSYFSSEFAFLKLTIHSFIISMFIFLVNVINYRWKDVNDE